MTNWLIWFLPIVMCGLATAYDLRRREIPDWIPLAVFAGAFILALFDLSRFAWWEHLAGALVATSAALCIGWGDRFGGGDVKLFGALGAWFGLFAVIPLAMWIAIAGLPLAVIAAIRKQSDFAYAPAILLGVCVHCVSPDLIQRIMM